MLGCGHGRKVQVLESFISAHPCEDENENESENESENENESESEVEETNNEEENECPKFELDVTRYFQVMCNIKRSSICPFAITPHMYAGKKPCEASTHYLRARYVCK